MIHVPPTHAILEYNAKQDLMVFPDVAPAHRDTLVMDMNVDEELLVGICHAHQVNYYVHLIFIHKPSLYKIHGYALVQIVA